MRDTITTSAVSADLFRRWLAERGGILEWGSVDLSDPDASWLTPALRENGVPYGKPTWKSGETPVAKVTDPAKLFVIQPKEVKRFYVAVRPGSQGLSLKVSDGGTRRIRAAVAKAGEGAWYEFDYGTQEAVIYVPGGAPVALVDLPAN